MHKLLLVFVSLFIATHAVPVCLYLHGIGQPGPPDATNKLYDAPNDKFYYWKNVPNAIPSSVCKNYFLWAQTKTRGWDSYELIKEYCNAIDKVQPNIVFTHSMGNLIVAAGVALEITGCKKIKTGDVYWFGDQGPLAGAEPAVLGLALCDALRDAEGQINKDVKNAEIIVKNTVKKFQSKAKSFWDKIKGWFSFSEESIADAKTQVHIDVVSKIKFCNDNYQSLVPGYQSALVVGNSKLKLCSLESDEKCLKYYAAKYMKGNLCGYDPVGGDIFSTDFVNVRATLLLPIVAAATQMGVKWNNSDEKKNIAKTGNDGLVGSSSCRIGKYELYKQSPTDRFFAFNGNHLGGTCYDKVEACSWMYNMVKQYTLEKSKKLFRQLKLRPS